MKVSAALFLGFLFISGTIAATGKDGKPPTSLQPTESDLGDPIKHVFWVEESTTVWPGVIQDGPVLGRLTINANDLVYDANDIGFDTAPFVGTVDDLADYQSVAKLQWVSTAMSTELFGPYNFESSITFPEGVMRMSGVMDYQLNSVVEFIITGGSGAYLGAVGIAKAEIGVVGEYPGGIPRPGYDMKIWIV